MGSSDIGAYLLAPLSGCGFASMTIRGYRCAQPPANGFDPSRGRLVTESGILLDNCTTRSAGRCAGPCPWLPGTSTSGAGPRTDGVRASQGHWQTWHHSIRGRMGQRIQSIASCTHSASILVLIRSQVSTKPDSAQSLNVPPTL